MEIETIKSTSPTQIFVLKYQGVLSRNIQAHLPIEWFDIIIKKKSCVYIYIYNPTTENTDDMKNGLYEKLENFVYCSLFFPSWLTSLPQLLKDMLA